MRGRVSKRTPAKGPSWARRRRSCRPAMWLGTMTPTGASGSASRAAAMRCRVSLSEAMFASRIGSPPKAHNGWTSDRTRRRPRCMAATCGRHARPRPSGRECVPPGAERQEPRRPPLAVVPGRTQPVAALRAGPSSVRRGGSRPVQAPCVTMVHTMMNRYDGRDFPGHGGWEQKKGTFDGNFVRPAHGRGLCRLAKGL